MIAFLLALVLPDVSLLGSPDWRAREECHRRLAALGTLAWPVLLGAAESENPEVRFRVALLLTPYREWREDRRAWDVLTGPWPPHYPTFFGDDQLRRRVHRRAIGAGIPRSDAQHLNPDEDVWDWFRAVVPPEVLCSCALARCRRALGAATWLVE